MTAVLTSQQIDALPAGRELDALVAEKVFGWVWVREDTEQPDAVPYLVGPHGGAFYPSVANKYPELSTAGGDIPAYSTDIAAAWEVAMRFDSRGVTWNAYDKLYQAEVTQYKPETFASGRGETAPLAISRAALKAVCQP